jgi:diguanylate cyclase (GGDEF)-like protein
MLWNKRKPSDPSRVAENLANKSGYRVAEPDRALTVIGTLLKAYGRFAFDAEQPADALRDRCEDWAQRILLGERSPRDGDAGPGTSGELAVSRDFRGLERFFSEQRQSEGEYVTRSLGGLRETVLSLARSLGGSVAEDRDADGQIEERLVTLSRAVDEGQIKHITRAAMSVIEASRSFMQQRREREARHVQKLDRELRQLREEMAASYHAGKGCELTGLAGRAQLEQQLDQLLAIGMLLEKPPWLMLVDVAAAKRDGAGKPRPVPDAALRDIGHCINRSFLRREDFTARSGAREFSVLVVDMTQAEVTAATERLLSAVAGAARTQGNNAPSVAVGVVRFRPNEDAERLLARAALAVERARRDSFDGYDVSL